MGEIIWILKSIKKGVAQSSGNSILGVEQRTKSRRKQTISAQESQVQSEIQFRAKLTNFRDSESNSIFHKLMNYYKHKLSFH